MRPDTLFFCKLLDFYLEREAFLLFLIIMNRVIIIDVFLVLLLHINFGYRKLSSNCFKKKTNYRISRYDEDIVETRQTEMHVNTVPSLKGVKTKIVQLISPSSIEAVQIRHVEVETKEMATFCKSLLTNDSFSFNKEMSTSQSVLWDFASLAANISRCERSRVVGGDLGWVFLDQIEDGNRDDLLVSLAREATVLQKGV